MQGVSLLTTFQSPMGCVRPVSVLFFFRLGQCGAECVQGSCFFCSYEFLWPWWQ